MDNLSLLYPEGYGEKKRASHRMKNYDFIKELQLESLRSEERRVGKECRL